MNTSIWNIKKKKFKNLDNNTVCDILIVGGGITGLSLCYYLKDTNYKITLIEQNEILNSTTLKTTAKLTYLQQDLLSKIKKTYDKNIAKEYLNSQINAINNITNIIVKEQIDCDLEESDSYLFTSDKENIKKIKTECKLYEEFGIKCKKVRKLPNNTNVKYGFKVKNTYVFHPIKYCLGLLECFKENINIYEKTRMIKYKKINNHYLVYLNNNLTIKCKYLIIASHYPTFIYPYFFPFRTYIEKDNIICEKSKNYKFNAINIDKDLISIRYYKDYIIKVVNSNKLSANSINNIDKNTTFSNYDIITQDYLPIIGEIRKNLFLATGYNTWGMTNSNLAALTISELIINGNSKYKDLFNPKRRFSFNKLFNFIINNVYSIYNFISSKIIKKDKVTIKYIDGKKYGVYTDEFNKEHFVHITCPHMKCSLFFNKKEKTWDCPCHGSKFSIDGELIKGPSTSCITKD